MILHTQGTYILYWIHRYAPSTASATGIYVRDVVFVAHYRALRLLFTLSLYLHISNVHMCTCKTYYYCKCGSASTVYIYMLLSTVVYAVTCCMILHMCAVYSSIVDTYIYVLPQQLLLPVATLAMWCCERTTERYVFYFRFLCIYISVMYIYVHARLTSTASVVVRQQYIYICCYIQ